MSSSGRIGRNIVVRPRRQRRGLKRSIYSSCRARRTGYLKLPPSARAWRQICGELPPSNTNSLHNSRVVVVVGPLPCRRPCSSSSAVARRNLSTLTRLPAASPSSVMDWMRRCVVVHEVRFVPSNAPHSLTRTTARRSRHHLAKGHPGCLSGCYHLGAR